ncbi:MAG: hypothetical protein AAB359_04275, partial [Elusimicrobiota bacterium]
MKIIIAMLLFPRFAYGAADLQKADQFFLKGLYQEALTAYSSATVAAGEDGLKALYRSAECEALLLRYGEAAQR